MDEMLFQSKTRLEYYLATAAGFTPGEDFPIMYDVEPKTNIEKYINAIANPGVDMDLPDPKTVKEYYIKSYAEQHGGQPNDVK